MPKIKAQNVAGIMNLTRTMTATDKSGYYRLMRITNPAKSSNVHATISFLITSRYKLCPTLVCLKPHFDKNGDLTAVEAKTFGFGEEPLKICYQFHAGAMAVFVYAQETWNHFSVLMLTADYNRLNIDETAEFSETLTSYLEAVSQKIGGGGS